MTHSVLRLKGLPKAFYIPRFHPSRNDRGEHTEMSTRAFDQNKKGAKYELPSYLHAAVCRLSLSLSFFFFLML